MSVVKNWGTMAVIMFATIAYSDQGRIRCDAVLLKAYHSKTIWRGNMPRPIFFGYDVAGFEDLDGAICESLSRPRSGLPTARHRFVPQSHKDDLSAGNRLFPGTT